MKSAVEALIAAMQADEVNAVLPVAV